jgi:hypothetical protein
VLPSRFILGFARKRKPTFVSSPKFQKSGLTQCRFGGHIMTTMNTHTLPKIDPNDTRSIKSHRNAVCKKFASLFDAIDLTFAESVPRAADIFKLFGGAPDLTVHAANTRYLAKVSLDTRNLPFEDEEVPDYEMPHIANCGLCLHLEGCEVRILKAALGGIPKAASEARSRFYSSNQLTLPFDSSDSSAGEPTLNLIILWDVGTDYSYSGIEIACPRGERNDRTVDCFWKTRWERKSSLAKIRPSNPEEPGADLDEIRGRVTPINKATS